MIRPVEFYPRIDSRQVVAIAEIMGKNLTIGEADQLLKDNITPIQQVLQDTLNAQVASLVLKSKV